MSTTHNRDASSHGSWNFCIYPHVAAHRSGGGCFFLYASGVTERESKQGASKSVVDSNNIRFPNRRSLAKNQSAILHSVDKEMIVAFQGVTRIAYQSRRSRRVSEWTVFTVEPGRKKLDRVTLTFWL